MKCEQFGDFVLSLWAHWHPVDLVEWFFFLLHEKKCQQFFAKCRIHLVGLNEEWDTHSFPILLLSTLYCLLFGVFACNDHHVDFLDNDSVVLAADNICHNTKIMKKRPNFQWNMLVPLDKMRIHRQLYQIDSISAWTCKSTWPSSQAMTSINWDLHFMKTTL